MAQYFPLSAKVPFRQKHPEYKYFLANHSDKGCGRMLVFLCHLSQELEIVTGQKDLRRKL